MKAADLKACIEQAAAHVATQTYPTFSEYEAGNLRAASFVAALSGALIAYDRHLSEKVWHVVQPPAAE
jgi:hypothetical protein